MPERIKFRCDFCERVDERDPVPSVVGTADDSARAAGWRLGATKDGGRVAICPECAGTDEEYWDLRTLNMAYAAGIDAGNTAWTG